MPITFNIPNPIINENKTPTPEFIPFAERRYTPEQKAAMKTRKKEALANGVLLPGMKDPTTAPSRKRLTDNDLSVLLFLGRFRYATARQLAIYLGVTYATANNRLTRLMKMKLVDQEAMIGVKMLWFCKKAGLEILEDRSLAAEDELFKPAKEGITASRVAHTLAVNQCAAIYISNGLPITDLVTEPYIESAFGKVSWGNTDPTDRGAANENLRRDILRDLKAGKIQPSEFINDNPSLWVLSNRSSYQMATKQYHQPDLIINQEDERTDGTRHSIAIEVELTLKSVNEYKKILQTYKDDKLIYAQVIWFCKSSQIKTRLNQAATEIGLTSDRITITDFTMPDGTPYRGTGAL